MRMRDKVSMPPPPPPPTSSFNSLASRTGSSLEKSLLSSERTRPFHCASAKSSSQLRNSAKKNQNIKAHTHTNTHTMRSKAAVDRLLPRCDEPQTSSRRPFQSRSFLRGGKKNNLLLFQIFLPLPLPSPSDRLAPVNGSTPGLPLISNPPPSRGCGGRRLSIRAEPPPPPDGRLQ